MAQYITTISIALIGVPTKNLMSRYKIFFGNYKLFNKMN